MASSASHCLKVSMYAAFGKAGAICQAPNALFAVCTNRVENGNALGPQSHGVGPCSEGWLQLEKSALQSTRWTPACPALRRCPPYPKEEQGKQRTLRQGKRKLGVASSANLLDNT